MKIAAVVIGVVCGWSLISIIQRMVDVKWVEMENATRSALTNIGGHAIHALNNTASQFAAHTPTIETAGLPVAAAFGFMPGLMFGLKRG